MNLENLMEDLVVDASFPELYEVSSNEELIEIKAHLEDVSSMLYTQNIYLASFFIFILVAVLIKSLVGFMKIFL